MLSAKKNENRLEAVTPTTPPTTAGAVGNVVDSIQNLRQRLNDFGLEEVAKAETTSKTLLFRLADLQCRLRSLAAIKRSMTAVRDVIEQASNDDFNVSTLEKVNSPIHLQEIVKASKLIKFPGIHRRSQQQAQEIAPDTAGNSQISPTAKTLSEPVQETVQAFVDAYDPQISDPEIIPEYNDQPAALAPASLVSSEHFPWHAERISTFHENEAEELKENRLTEPAESLAQVLEPMTGEIIATKPEGVLSNVSVRAEQPNSSTPTALVSVGADFDRQLLDDLIKSYGEFVSSPELRPTVEPQTKPAIVVAGTVKNFSETPPSRDVIDSTNRHLPTLKKEGEIDRQLKKIIKDYGEYDIYSRQSPINLKFGVIGAFLLLGAVFSGFYFLSSPTIESSNHPAIIQPTTMPSSSESVAADKNNRGRNAASGNRESK